MNIQEAAKKAIKIEGVICRKQKKGEKESRYGVIKPTNSYDTCILLIIKDGKIIRSCRAWNPTAEDLIADDWEVLRDKF